MQFNLVFERRKGAGSGLALGSDGVAGTPPTAKPEGLTNVIKIRPVSDQGWPVHRIALGYNPNGAVGPVNLPCELWIYDRKSNSWFQIEATKNIIPNRITFFDVVALLNNPITQASLSDGGAGTAEVFVRISDNSAPDALYIFAVGADLTPLAV